MPHFDLEYEVLMKNLKSDFLACKKWELYCGLQYVSQNDGHAWLRTLQERYRVHLAELQQQLSNEQDADAATAAENLQSALTDEQAAMEAQAQYKPQSLFNYLS